MRLFFSLSMLISIALLAVFPSHWLLSLTGAIWLLSSLFIYGDVKQEAQQKNFDKAMKAFEDRRKYRIW